MKVLRRTALRTRTRRRAPRPATRKRRRKRARSASACVARARARSRLLSVVSLASMRSSRGPAGSRSHAPLGLVAFDTTCLGSQGVVQWGGVNRQAIRSTVVAALGLSTFWWALVRIVLAFAQSLHRTGAFLPNMRFFRHQLMCRAWAVLREDLCDNRCDSRRELQTIRTSPGLDWGGQPGDLAPKWPESSM